MSANYNFCTWRCAKVAKTGQWLEAESDAVKKRNRNDRTETAWNTLVRSLRKRNILSSMEVTRLTKQYTDVSPDYALRRLRQNGVLQQLKNGPRGLYVVVNVKNDAFITDPTKSMLNFGWNSTIFGEYVCVFV